MVVEQVTYANIDPKTRTMIMVGLTFAMLIACLDGTVVGTSGTIIAQDLGGLGLFSWMATAYLLCETVMIPIAGKLSDLYGRKPLFLIGLGIFVAGSFVAGLSTNMTMFIICRAIQGLGGGILIPVAMAAVADLYSPQERPRMQGMLGAVFGIGSGIGPLVGGYITQYISWHWCFYINIPLAIIAFALTLKKFPTPEAHDVHVDYKGITTLSAFLLQIVLFFEFGGTKFEWLSIQSAALIAVAVIQLIIFSRIEKTAVEPIVAPHLLHNRTVIVACVIMFMFGLALMGAMMYSNMLFLYVLDSSMDTLKAGEYSIAMVVGMMITSMSSGFLVNKTGYRPWIIGGQIITIFSFFMFSTVNVGTSLAFYALCLFVLGIGLGCMMAVVMVGVQNSASESEMGMTTSQVNLLRSIGTTVGTAIFAMIIAGKIDGEILKVLPAAGDYILSLADGTDILSLLVPKSLEDIQVHTGVDPITIAGGIIKSFANSVDFTFLIAAIFMAFVAVAGFFYKAPLAPQPAHVSPFGRRRKASAEVAEQTSEEPAEETPAEEAAPAEDQPPKDE